MLPVRKMFYLILELNDFLQEGIKFTSACYTCSHNPIPTSDFEPCCFPT